MCHCWVNEEADGKKKQELKELFVPDIIKFLFNRLPRTAIFTEFQKLCEQNQDHIWEHNEISTHYRIGKQDVSLLRTSSQDSLSPTNEELKWKMIIIWNCSLRQLQSSCQLKQRLVT